jgi:tRNA (cmo5U34)-methyltransferase
MSAALNGFNWLAPYYDRLTTLVFRGRLQEAQRTYLNLIPRDAHVLIIGGGTGWLLNELMHVNPSCHIYYVDASVSMIDLAKCKVSAHQGHRIVFIAGTQDSIPAQIEFDVVITHFFLDLFSSHTIAGVIGKLNGSLRKNGLWLISDFVNKKWWQEIMLAVMYAFFRVTCRIEATKLPDWTRLLKHEGLEESRSAYFFKSFIKSSVFIKGSY